MANERPQRTRCPIDVFQYLDYRAFLAEYYQAKKARGFSYRSFSRVAGLGAPNYLKLVIGGRRNLTPAMAARFAEACGLRGEAARYFGVLVELGQARTQERRNAAYGKLTAFDRYRRAHKLELAHAAYHSRWYLPAIRELVASPHFEEDPEKIAEALWPEVKPLEVRQAIDTLLALGLLVRDAHGRLQQAAAVVSTGPETQGLHIRNYHAEMMRRATQAMELVPAASRDVSSLTMCVSAKSLAAVKQRIQELRRELIELVESEPDKSQVVQLNLQLFPLTQSLEAKKKAPARRKEPRHA
jgi:uncharacterized protein (TIGR02147 family)